jgi:hypothetical protein
VASSKAGFQEDRKEVPRRAPVGLDQARIFTSARRAMPRIAFAQLLIGANAVWR